MRSKLAWMIVLCVVAWVGICNPTFAADHGDAPSVAHDRGADIGDIYFFLDPNDNSRVILIATVHGFIVPGEAVNFGIFDPALRYRFEIENTGDAKPDRFIDVRFSRRTDTMVAQTATIELPGGGRFTAAATNPSLATAPPTPVVTTDPASGVMFFAGEVDDPFFFDIPAFSRFVASVRSGSPNPGTFNRRRDSFAGYNTLAIVLSVPADLLRGTAGDEIGLDFLTQRRTEKQTDQGEIKSSGTWRRVDRAGNPAVNVALIPFSRKNIQNASTTRDDANGRFRDDILGTLALFGTNEANSNVFLAVAVDRGDFLRLNLAIVNSGPGGGNNAGAGFPNGRRLGDDVIDVLLTLINNGSPLGDNVGANDVPLRDAFPFVGASQQPREGDGNVEDNTRN